MPESPLIKKLRIKAEHPLLILNMPADCAALFADTEYRTTKPRSGTIEQLVLFAKTEAMLEEKMLPLVPMLGEDPIVWVVYPKKSGKIKTDLSMMGGWKPVEDAGLATVASAAVNDDWSAIRLRPSTQVKGALAPQSERSNEFVDYTKRTTKLPPDAAAAVKKHKGMTEFFDALAFTHRKEHVEAIIQAKKPETRERRIDKMIDMLKAGMSAKAAKKK
ncbi:MAG: YdeI/OmpD-associated family protein [Gemmatimonas sp.]